MRIEILVNFPKFSRNYQYLFFFYGWLLKLRDEQYSTGLFFAVTDYFV